MSGHLEVLRLKMTLRSPVHIGSHVRQFSPLEAAAFGNRVYKVSEDKLATGLQARNLLDPFVQEARRSGTDFDLRGFLEQQGLLSKEFLDKVAEFSVAAPGGFAPRMLAAFRPIARDGFGRAYIPGTSIKGAVRTALLNVRIEQASEREREGVNTEVEYQLQRRARREHFAADIVRPWLEGQLPLGRRNPRNVRGPHLDFLRSLKVSDARYEGDTQVLPVKVLSLRQGDSDFYLKEQMLLECLPAGAELSCSLTLDQPLLKDFKSQGPVPFESLEQVLGQVQDFAEQVLDEEFDFFGGLTGMQSLTDFYHSTDANLRLGLGSGLPATTILLTLRKDLRLRVRDQVFQRRNNGLFPKSKKVVVDRERPVSSLGWVHWEAF